MESGECARPVKDSTSYGVDIEQGHPFEVGQCHDKKSGEQSQSTPATRSWAVKESGYECVVAPPREKSALNRDAKWEVTWVLLYQVSHAGRDYSSNWNNLLKYTPSGRKRMWPRVPMSVRIPATRKQLTSGSSSFSGRTSGYQSVDFSMPHTRLCMAHSRQYMTRHIPAYA